MGSYLSVFRVFIENFILSMRHKSLTSPGFDKEMEDTTIYLTEIESPLAVGESSFQNLPDLLNETFNISLSSLYNPVISYFVLCRHNIMLFILSFKILIFLIFNRTISILSRGVRCMM